MGATNLSMHISSQSHISMLENQCTNIQDLKKIHAHFIKTGLSKHTLPISRVLAFAATSPAADINYAYSIFTRIHNPNIFMWNTIIRGFSQSSVPQNAILLFIYMLNHSNIEPQRLTYPSLFKAYTQLGLPRSGAQLHGRVIKLGLGFDRFIRNTIIYMYANSGFLSEAYKIFDEEGDFDVVTWNSMIMGLAKTREIDEAMRLFDKMGLRRNDVSWNCMISGSVRNGKFVEAMILFERMQEERIKASEFTLVSLLNSCANLGALEQGEWICDYILCKNRFKLNVIMVTSIVDMYSKCGAIDKARRFFEFAPIKGLSSWNSMILGLANNGCEEEAFELFYELISLKIEPNEVTFLGLLIACSYKGYVNQARDFFLLMKKRYKIEPSVKHYSCMVDVLGQAGLLNEAEQLIKEMPMEPDAIIWGSLLSSCRKYGNVEMAIRAGRHISEINSNDSAGYILMSNVYAASGQFENAIRQRVLMKEKHVPKEKGCSSIEINGHVQEFGSAGKLHPHIQDLMFFLHSYNEDGNLSIEEDSM